MKKNPIKLKNKDHSYTLKKSLGSRHIKLSVRSDACIYVSAPVFLSQKRIEAFLLEKADWLIKRVAFYEEIKTKKVHQTGALDYRRKKSAVRALVQKKLKEHNTHYGYTYKTISIRNQSSRWGSCSALGSLNFNYRIIYLPEALIDYIIVHELCHLKQMNHSPRFWKLVGETIPDYKQARRELKKQGLLLF